MADKDEYEKLIGAAKSKFKSAFGEKDFARTADFDICLWPVWKYLFNTRISWSGEYSEKRRVTKYRKVNKNGFEETEPYDDVEIIYHPHSDTFECPIDICLSGIERPSERKFKLPYWGLDAYCSDARPVLEGESTLEYVDSDSAWKLESGPDILDREAKERCNNFTERLKSYFVNVVDCHEIFCFKPVVRIRYRGEGEICSMYFDERAGDLIDDDYDRFFGDVPINTQMIEDDIFNCYKKTKTGVNVLFFLMLINFISAGVFSIVYGFQLLDLVFFSIPILFMALIIIKKERIAENGIDPATDKHASDLFRLFDEDEDVGGLNEMGLILLKKKRGGKGNA